MPQSSQLPSAIEAENAILSAAIQDKVAFALLLGRLKPDDFHDERNRTFARVLFDDFDATTTFPDAVAVTSRLRLKGKYDELGGADYIKFLLGRKFTDENVETYLNDIKTTSNKRFALIKAGELQQMSLNGRDTRQIAEFIADVARDLHLRDPMGEDTTSVRFPLVDAADFIGRPLPEYIVDGFLIEKTISCIVGPTATYKSFVALSLAACIATGRPWHGRSVRQSPVVYISGEGSGGLPMRQQAWEIVNGPLERGQLYFLPEAVNFIQAADLQTLIRRIEELPVAPGFIVIDTLARSMVGGDENSARDMGIFVAGATDIQTRFGCHVMIIHHFGLSGKSRGSTSFPCALDTTVIIERNEDHLTLTCDKQKDHPPFEPIGLIRRIVQLDDTERFNTSLVFEHTDQTVQQTEASGKQAAALNVLAEAGESGLKAAEWQVACETVNIPRRSFYRYLDILVQSGRVIESHKTYFVKAD